MGTLNRGWHWLLCVTVLPGMAQTVPKIWYESAMESGILKPPVGGAIVIRVTAEYYYRMQERVVYRHYPVYGSKSEPNPFVPVPNGFFILPNIAG